MDKWRKLLHVDMDCVFFPFRNLVFEPRMNGMYEWEMPDG
jgi:hypothetical protein